MQYTASQAAAFKQKNKMADCKDSTLAINQENERKIQ